MRVRLGACVWEVALERERVWRERERESASMTQQRNASHQGWAEFQPTTAL